MAASKTGELPKEFLNSTYTIPVETTHASNRGDSEVEPRIGNGKRRTFNRLRKGSTNHVVTSAGTPTKVHDTFYSSSDTTHRGRRLEGSA